jgi:hypothetical protein
MPFVAVIPFPFLFIVVFLIAMSILANKKSTQAIEEGWTEAGRRLGIRYQRNKGMSVKRKLEGSYRGYRIRINTFIQSHGKGSSTYTRYTLIMPSLRLGMELTQQHFLSGITDAFSGGKDQVVGDEAFDKAVIVHSKNAAATDAFLTTERRNEIRLFLTNTRRGRITDDEISYIVNGVEKKGQTIQAGIDKLVALADTFVEGKPSRSKQGLESRHRKQAVALDGDLGFSKTAVEKASSADFFTPTPLIAAVIPSPSNDGNLDLPSPPTAESTDSFPWRDREVDQTDALAAQQEAEFAAQKAAMEEAAADHAATAEATRLQAASDHAAAEQAAAALAAADQAALEQAVDEPQVATDASPEEVLDPPVALVDYLTLRRELFESSAMSSDAVVKFESTYVGREVSWTGKMRRITSFSSDFVFKNSTGSKATIELEGIADGSFTKGVQAILQLPEDAVTEFGSRYDIEVAFTGKLHSCDGFLRDIFIESGTLTAL